MKLSHLLIATLIGSATVANAQGKIKKSVIKDEKPNLSASKKQKKAAPFNKNAKVDVSLNEPKQFVCTGCGRG